MTGLGKLSAAAFAAALSCAAFAEGDVPRYDVPKARKAPVVDGVIDRGEYDGAMTVKGVANYRLAKFAGKEPKIDDRAVECAITWDDGFIYFASRSEVPGGKPVVANSRLNPIHGDSVELWISPPEAARVGEFARFGQFQLIVDSSGRVKGMQSNPGYGLPARKWKVDSVRVGNCLHDGLWDVEIAVPASAFGAEKIPAGEWRLLPCRNLRSEPSVQTTFVPFAEVGGYSVDAGYPVFTFAESGKPTVLGGAAELFQRGVPVPVPGNITVKVRVSSDVPPNKYRRIFSTMFRGSGYLGLQQTAAHDFRQNLGLFYHATDRKAFKNFTSGKLPEKGEEYVYSANIAKDRIEIYGDGQLLGSVTPDIELKSGDLGDFHLFGGVRDGLEILSAEVAGRNLSSEEIKAAAVGDKGVAGTVRWCPSERLFAAELSIPAEIAEKGVEAVVKGPDGKTVASWTLPRDGTFATVGSGRRRMLVVHDKLVMSAMPPAGKCRIEVSVKGESKPSIEKEFLSKEYEWFHTKVGTADIVLPGFKPIKVDGRKVCVVQREYAIGDNGLPAQMVSMGRPILAAPVALFAERDGKTVEISGGALSAIRRVSDTKAEYSSAGKVGVKGRVEQDGLVILDLTLPAKSSAERIYMDIPLKAEFADLYHAAGEGLRSNPAGDIPSGTGRVFGSRSIPQSHVENFIPYCWIGTDDRGVLYAADCDRGWIHVKDRDAVEVIRDDSGDVRIRLNLVNAPYEGASPRHIELALQATPVKPMPDGWRGWADTYYDRTCTRAMRNLASTPTWSAFQVGMARYPTFGDFEVVRKLDEAVRTGKIDKPWVSNWIERCWTAYEKTPELVRWIKIKPSREAARTTLVNHVNGQFHMAASLHGKPNPTLYYYTCDCDPNHGLYELDAMADEWGAHSHVFGSYQDYAIYYLDKMIEAGMRGVYDDNAYFWCNYDWVAGRAWIDEKGEVHPSLSLWALREFCRRQVVVMVERGIDPWLTIHHTNANILPAIAFATNTMGMEWKYGNSEYQDRYTPGYMRAVNQGLQGGFYPTSLEGIFNTKSAEEKAWLSRTMFAAFLPHEIHPTLQHTCDWRGYCKLMDRMMAFGINEKDCVYTAYWDKANPVKNPDRDVLVSVYRRGKKLILAMGSFADGDRKLSLGFPGKVKGAVNLENGTQVDISNFTLKKRDFAVAEVELQ